VELTADRHPVAADIHSGLHEVGEGIPGERVDPS
jgi:hypothetical protein